MATTKNTDTNTDEKTVATPAIVADNIGVQDAKPKPKTIAARVSPETYDAIRKLRHKLEIDKLGDVVDRAIIEFVDQHEDLLDA